MSSILPFAPGPHPVWSPMANEIHAAIWDHIGLEGVRRHVREWASDRVACIRASRAAKQEERTRARQALHCPDDWTLYHTSRSLPDDRQLKEAIRDPERPALPLPPSHRERSVTEKWAALAAVHDVFDLTGDKVLPWPLPEDHKDLAAFAAWARGEGGSYFALMQAASELKDDEDGPVRRWLRDAQAEGEDLHLQDTGGHTNRVRSRATVNERMAGTIMKNPEAMGWNSPQWARHLKCGKASVVETPTWKRLESARLQARAERMKDRHRKPKGSDSRRD